MLPARYFQSHGSRRPFSRSNRRGSHVGDTIRHSPEKISREVRPYPGMPTEGPIGFWTFLQHVNKRAPSKLMTSWSSRVVQNLYWNRAFAHHTFAAMEVTGLTFTVLSEVRTQATSIIKRIALFKTGPTRLAGTCACVTRLAITVDAIQEIGTRNYSSFPEEIFHCFALFSSPHVTICSP